MNGKSIVIGILILALGVGGGYYFASNYKVTPQATPAVTPTTETITPLPTGGPTPTQTVKAATPTVDETATLIAAMKAAIIAKRGQDASSLDFTVNKIQGNYAQGAASSGQGGGMWFAAKVNGVWKLVWDGNGTILCTDLTNYPDFPNTMIPECWNDATQKSVTR